MLRGPCTVLSHPPEERGMLASLFHCAYFEDNLSWREIMSEKNIAAFYSKAELARHFNVPESTIRFYCTRFADFLPCTGEGRKRRYAFACLEILAFIRKQLPVLRTSEAVERALAEHFPRTLLSSAIHAVQPAKPSEQGQSRIQTMTENSYNWGINSIHERFFQLMPPENLPAEHQGTAPSMHSSSPAEDNDLRNSLMERIGEALECLNRENREKTGKLEARADETDRELNALREEVQNMRLLLTTAEKTQQADIEQLRSLLLRVARTLTEKNTR